MIRQLFDNRNGEVLTIDDIPENRPRPELVDDISHNDQFNSNYHEFELYRHQKGEQPFQSDYVKQRTRMKAKTDRTDPPFRLYLWQGDKRILDRSKVVYELWRRYGEGCFNVYWIGGNPPMEQILQRTWIKKVV